MKRLKLVGLVVTYIGIGFALTLDSFTVETCAQDKCAKYYGKGYCTDYIKEQTGKKQSGNAGTWRGNIRVKDVKKGDVAIFSSPGVGHVAIVDRVIYEHNTDKPYEIDISEKNWGSPSTNAEEKACYVTKMFNKVSRRTVRVSTVKAFWRP